MSATAVSRSGLEILRQIHRSIAIVLSLFITLIGLTGAILQGIMVRWGDPGPASSTVLPPDVAAFRQIVVRIHTGFLIGVPGAYYGLICGLGLLFFSLSGIYMYLVLYRGRTGLGRRGLFWATKLGDDATVRSLHRWFTVGIVLFTTLISFTGASLDFDFVRNNMIPGAGPRPGGAPPGGPGGPPGGAGGGAGGGPAPAGAGWHMLCFNLHKLDFLGTAGHVIGVFVGLGLALMGVSGIWMYLAMRRRRVTSGQSGFFW